MIDIDSLLEKMKQDGTFQEIIKNNPVMTSKDVMTVGCTLPRAQRRANIKWLEKVGQMLKQEGIWYYEAADMLFTRVGTGWVLLAGGLKEMSDTNPPTFNTLHKK